MKFFKKSILAITVLLLLAGSALAATFTARQAGNFTDWNTWFVGDPGGAEGSQYPGPNDNVALASFAVAVNQATTPSTGALGTITAATGGYLSFDMTARNYTFACTTITPGSVGAGGFLVFNGVAPAATAVINCVTVAGSGTTQTRNIYNNSTGTVTVNASTSVLGGTATNTRGVSNNTTGAVAVVTPLCQGGSGTGAHAVHNETTGTVNITAANITAVQGYGFNNVVAGPTTIYGPTIITGGTSTGGFGMWSNAIAPTFNTAGGQIQFVDGTKAVPYTGYPPTWSTAPTATNYYRMYNNGSIVTWAPVLTAAQIKNGVVSGGGAGAVTGTYVGSSFGMIP
jgi:hypothetical protein